MTWCTCSHRMRIHRDGRCLGAGGTCACRAPVEARLIGAPLVCAVCKRAGVDTLQQTTIDGVEVLAHPKCLTGGS